MVAPNSWTPVQLEITRKLVLWRRRFVTTGRKVDTNSEKGYMVVTSYLQCLDAAFQEFEVKPASRHYRQSFAPKYQKIWHGQSRLLRVEVLEASNQQMIWMNGRWFELSPTAMILAGHMRHAWAELGRLLKRLHEEQLAARPWDISLNAELRGALEKLDAAWANFEHAYVIDSMAIEEQALELLAVACVCERDLSDVCYCSDGDDPQGGGAYCQEQLGELVRVLILLSNAAGVENGTRAADWRLVTRGLLEARSILESTSLQNHHQRLGPAHALATRAIDAFEAVRDHLSNLWHCWEFVDGQLANNPGLVDRLAYFVESLTATARYLADPRLLCALNGAVAFVRAACAAAPELAVMGAERDADVFLVLPRLVWLSFLSAPDLNGPLIEHALPELSSELRGSDPDLQALVEAHGQTVGELAAATGDGHPAPKGGGPEGHRRAIDALVRRAVVGICREPSGSAPLGCAASAAAEAFQLRLEGWSMRLQRRQPEVWNELAAVLIDHVAREVAGEERGISGCEEPRGLAAGASQTV